MIIDFNLTLLNLTPNSLSDTNVLRKYKLLPEKKQRFASFTVRPVPRNFIVLSVLNLNSICGEQNLTFLVLVFHHLLVL